MGVALNTETWQQSFFNQHTEDVLCIAVHEGKGVAATGQLDPKGRCKVRARCTSQPTCECNLPCSALLCSRTSWSGAWPTARC